MGGGTVQLHKTVTIPCPSMRRLQAHRVRLQSTEVPSSEPIVRRANHCVSERDPRRSGPWSRTDGSRSPQLDRGDPHPHRDPRDTLRGKGRQHVEMRSERGRYGFGLNVFRAALSSLNDVSSVRSAAASTWAGGIVFETNSPTTVIPVFGPFGV